MNSFGHLFRINIFGESHGPGVGIVVDGLPAGLQLEVADFNADLSRRRAGAKGTTPRKEADLPRLVNGVFNNFTTGAPLLIQFENTNTRSADYDKLREMPRPGHADFVASKKFGGFEDFRGGGHFSARITLGLVAAGVVAKKLLSQVSISAKLIEAGGNADVDAAVDRALEEQDSIGGIIECRIKGLPVGLGEPFFDSVESVLAHMMFSIPAVKGIEFGSGFAAARMRGSEHNDNILSMDGKTETNHAGGINGGITNGNELVFRLAIKPTSSISKEQKTLNVKTGKVESLVVEGRHDLCVALRAPVIVEAATAIVLADFMMQAQEIKRIIQ
ncbi:MAG: chorismate synthase [Bacteroidota bacterium]|nr:MAG: chorismate synthase [Bacteroidota bacterium]